MDTQKLFAERITELENLSNCPAIFWYVSAGNDFRGPNFLTDHHIQPLKEYQGREFIKPELFVYNCLGDEIQNLKEKLSKGDGVVLFSDNKTTVEGNNFKNLKMNNALSFEVNPNYIEINHIQQPQRGSEAFYFEIEIKGEGYTETQKILYFEAENIDFFNKVILKGFFNVVYLCATREGTGWGGCNKSIIEYIYKEGSPNFYINQGFKPKFNILFTDYTHTMFEEKINNSQILTITSNYGDYPYDDKKKTESLATIYKIEYPNL